MTKREQFLIHLMGYMRIPYVWGGDNPKVGLDCSGLAQFVLDYLKLDPPGDQTANDLMYHFLVHGKRVGINDADLLGCLIFFGGSGRATHVAIALGNGLMIEAGGGGSKCTTPEIARQIGAEVRMAPITRRSDLLCIIRPDGLPWGTT
jgi:cell wall-associated NlpC family hydrolase